MLKRNSILALSVVIVIATSITAFAQVQLDIQKIGKALSATMLECPERVWPNYNWKEVNVLISSDGQSPVVWRGENGQISILSNSQIPADAFNGVYSFLSFEGRKSVAFFANLDFLTNFGNESNRQALETIIHEGFHNIEQVRWQSKLVNQRGTLYPASSIPRLYRRMMFDRMKEYFISKGHSVASLAMAAYWYEKWKSEFAHEYRNSMDRIEGTARYVEYISSVLADFGCESSESNIYNAIVNKLNTEMGYSVSGSYFQLDAEAYDLGSLAGFILRFIKKDTTWYQQAVLGHTPMDILFTNIRQQEDQLPADLKNEFLTFADNQNKVVSGWLASDIALMNNHDSIRLVLNDSSFRSSIYSPKGFFLLSTMPDVILVPLARGVEFGNNEWKLSVLADSVMFKKIQSPCSGSTMFVTPQNSVTITNGQLDVKSNKLNGSMSGELMIDDKGVKWFCENYKE